jgi:hypothetical protein
MIQYVSPFVPGRVKHPYADRLLLQQKLSIVLRDKHHGTNL